MMGTIKKRQCIEILLITSYLFFGIFPLCVEHVVIIFILLTSTCSSEFLFILGLESKLLRDNSISIYAKSSEAMQHPTVVLSLASHSPG